MKDTRVRNLKYAYWMNENDEYDQLPYMIVPFYIDLKIRMLAFVNTFLSAFFYRTIPLV